MYRVIEGTCEFMGNSYRWKELERLTTTNGSSFIDPGRENMGYAMLFLGLKSISVDTCPHVDTEVLHSVHEHKK